ncbi:MAG: thiamine phosphate synthase [Gemmatimonadales bacterium]|nr:MAG: thiamine phosphate synthase [Gemmatimonadales bacterium]
MIRAARVPILHVVTDDSVLSRAEFLPRAREVLEAGGAEVALHLRGPSTEGGRLYQLARALLPDALTAGAWLVVNDRVDVVACVGAHAVQLGQRSLPVEEARRLLGIDPAIGVSVHSADEAVAARGADFLLVGTLFVTPSHPGRTGAGPDLLDQVGAAAPGTPRIGIGGITPERLSLLTEAGAHGFAVLRGVWGERAPAGAVERYLTRWHGTA